MRELGIKNFEKDAERLAVALSGAPGIREYHLVTPTHLTDSAANSWGGSFVAVAGTTYTFRPQDNSDIWPASARAVQIYILGQWAAASNTSYLNGKKPGGTYNEIQVRAIAAAIGISAQGIVQLDSNGYFELSNNGVNTTNSICRLLGYFM